MAVLSLLLILSLKISLIRCVTIYTTLINPTATGSAGFVVPTTLEAYNTETVTPPALPSPMPALNYDIYLPPSDDDMAGLSMKHLGNVLGFSIELSVENDVLGRNSTLLQVPFLNLMANIKSRAGAGAVVRVGGNTQEESKLYPNFGATYEDINKTATATEDDPTSSPLTDYDYDIFYAMRNISALVSVTWGFGLPFGNASNTTGIAEIALTAQELLGPWLIALQLGNEPDLYGVDERHRPSNYSVADFMDEWGATIAAFSPGVAEPSLLGPSVCCDQPGFEVSDLLNAGFVTGFAADLKVVSVQHYPSNNCNITGVVTPTSQEMFPTYLMHESAISLTTPYIDISQAAMAIGRPMFMYETNTASCGGFPGVSDSFGAGLWALDYTLQLAAANFTNALFHMGGQGTCYNPFTPPPSNLSHVAQWTMGPIYYSALACAETLFSPSNSSQIVDLAANGNNTYTPAYAIYDNGVPVKVALFNYMDDSMGEADLVVNIGIGGGTTGAASSTPASVQVRYMTAPSVSSKFNITWNGLSAGGQLEGDGILRGEDGTVTIQCDTTTGTCPIPVKGPQFALVFLDPSLSPAPSVSTETQTFPTTTVKTATATINQAVLATNNGRGGPGTPADMGSTSDEKLSWGLRRMNTDLSVVSVVGLGFAMVALGVGF